MRQHRYGRVAWVVILLAVAVMAAGVAQATPNVNSAVLCPRVFNDDPFSTLTQVNAYPAQIVYDDLASTGATGFANLHVWRLSTNGSSVNEYANSDNFRVCADVLITGNGQCEAGLQVVPWWNLTSPNFPDYCGVDGRFNVRTTDGEIACFGGRLPFYSFTGTYGLLYVKGTPIHLEMIYLSHSNTMADPATIEYKLTYNSTNYTSGPLPFDEGNTAEDPPHGLWGMLTPAAVGGHIQYFVAGSMGGNARVEWNNICYETLDVIPAVNKSWGGIKALYR